MLSALNLQLTSINVLTLEKWQVRAQHIKLKFKNKVIAEKFWKQKIETISFQG
jgi:hypothetical protein